MNIFYVDRCPIAAARSLCDKHVVKMILETAQLLSTAHRELDGDDYADAAELYKSTHKNHPSAVWVRSSTANYTWAYRHLESLCKEYTKRYGKHHKTERLLDGLKPRPVNIPPDRGMSYIETQPPQCMPEEYKCNPNTASHDDCVRAYRAYYCGDKMTQAWAKYDHTEAPSWISA